MTKKKNAFTLIEIMIVIAIIAVLSGIVIIAINISRSMVTTHEARADAELNQIHDAVYFYFFENHVWPDDVNRGLPAGIEVYLGDGDWPEAPFNDVSEYDWDNFIGSDGNQVLQISIRFCPLGESDRCEFPNADWAEDFDYYSSYYHCIQGICRAHPGKPDGHPGYCTNCGGN